MPIVDIPRRFTNGTSFSHFRAGTYVIPLCTPMPKPQRLFSCCAQRQLHVPQHEQHDWRIHPVSELRDGD